MSTATLLFTPAIERIVPLFLKVARERLQTRRTAIVYTRICPLTTATKYLNATLEMRVGRFNTPSKLLSNLIDASCEYDGAYRTIERATKLLSSGGFVVFSFSLLSSPLQIDQLSLWLAQMDLCVLEAAYEADDEVVILAQKKV